MKCLNCQGRHHISICEKKKPRSYEESGTTPTSPESSSTTSMHVNSRTPVFLQTAIAMVYNPMHPSLSMKTRLILDSGSQRSYVTHRIKDSLELEAIRSESLAIRTFGDSRERRQICDTVVIGVQTKDGSRVQLPMLTVPFICEPLSHQPSICARESFDHLDGLELADPLPVDCQLRLNILVGSDHYWRIVTGEVKHGVSGPTAIDTILGWVLSGLMSPIETFVNLLSIDSVHTLHVDVQDDLQSLNLQLSKFWDLEAIGIRDQESPVHVKFKETVSFDGERYEVRLPWREEHPPLSDNFDLCLRCLTGLIRCHHPGAS